MDVQMPVMNGYDATRAIREKGFTELPIIAMTASVMRGDKAQCLAAGMNDYLTKPVSLNELNSALVRWMPGVESVRLATIPPPAPGPGEPQVVLLPPSLPGMDVERGVATAGGKPLYYARFLQLFIEGFSGAAKAINTALANGDEETTIRELHTLKGTAGIVGAATLQETSAQLETQMKQNGAIPEQSLLQFEQQLAEVLESAGTLLERIEIGQASSVASARDDTSAARRVIEQLRTRLADHSYVTDEQVDQLEEELSSLVDPKAIRGLRTAIGNFSYDEALELLGKIEKLLPR